MLTHVSAGKVMSAGVVLVAVTLLSLALVSAIQFTPPEYTVSEGNGSITVTVCLETNDSEVGNETNITVTLSTLSQSAGNTCPPITHDGAVLKV